jgi:hypothetical protein
MDGIRAPWPKRAWVAWPGQGPVAPVLVWPLGPISLNSSSPDGSRDKILTPKKFQVNLSSGRFLKRKNTQNKFSCSA